MTTASADQGLARPRLLRCSNRVCISLTSDSLWLAPSERAEAQPQVASLGSSSFKKQAARFERTTACQAEACHALPVWPAEPPPPPTRWRFLPVLVFGLHHGAVVQSPSESQSQGTQKAQKPLLAGPIRPGVKQYCHLSRDGDQQQLQAATTVPLLDRSHGSQARAADPMSSLLEGQGGALQEL